MCVHCAVVACWWLWRMRIVQLRHTDNNVACALYSSLLPLHNMGIILKGFLSTLCQLTNFFISFSYKVVRKVYVLRFTFEGMGKRSEVFCPQNSLHRFCRVYSGRYFCFGSCSRSKKWGKKEVERSFAQKKPRDNIRRWNKKANVLPLKLLETIMVYVVYRVTFR